MEPALHRGQLFENLGGVPTGDMGSRPSLADRSHNLLPLVPQPGKLVFYLFCRVACAKLFVQLRGNMLLFGGTVGALFAILTASFRSGPLRCKLNACMSVIERVNRLAVHFCQRIKDA